MCDLSFCFDTNSLLFRLQVHDNEKRVDAGTVHLTGKYFKNVIKESKGNVEASEPLELTNEIQADPLPQMHDIW